MTCRLLLAAATTILALMTSSPAIASGGNGAPETTTPVKHFVTLMQENHTFDNYFGTYPGADGIPKDTCMPAIQAGRCVKPWHIADAATEDLGHNAETFKAQYNGGRMDGFVRAFAKSRLQNPRLPMGHYNRTDLPFYWNAADDFVLFDANFASARAGSVANHMYWVTATAGEGNDTIPPGGFKAPTIFDRLEKAGVSWKFYVENYDPSVTFRSRGASDRGAQVISCPLLAYARFVDDPELNKKIVPLDQYYEDLEKNELPAVSYMVPMHSSEHPPGSITAGEALASNLLSGLMRSSAWDSSAFMWTYDNGGGFYDHVRPPRVDRFGYGFRTPALLVSPYARKGHIDSTTIDFTSQLKFIEQNWSLAPLSDRDRDANGLMSAFDFNAPPRPAKFVSQEANDAAPVIEGQGVVYASYAAGLLLYAGITTSAVVMTRRRRRGLKA